MNLVHKKHNEAMDFAELAFLARINGNHAEAIDLSGKALQSELMAINALSDTDSIEPTYSVLHRSAATLALDCNNSALAEKLTATALAHSPPDEIAEELRDLFEQIHFRRHLLLRGVTLCEDEMQMSLSGRGVGYGVVQSEEFLERVSTASQVIYRIVERQNGRAFREAGRLKKNLRDQYEVFVSVPRASSLAVTLKLGQPSEQLNLPGVLDTAQVIDEFMDLMELANKSRLDELKVRIPDEAYYRNFVGLAKKIAPDGENVLQIGFTATRAGSDRFVDVRKTRSDFATLPVVTKGELPQFVTIKGVLRFADAIHGESGIIKIVEEEGGKSHDVKVPQGMMNDIVRPMWNSVVIVTGEKNGRYIILEDIVEAEELATDE